MEIPSSYAQRMQELLGDEYPAYLASMDQEREYSLRVNTRRWSISLAMDELRKPERELTAVPWVKEGFYYNNEEWRPAKSPYWHAGMFYLQEASAMTPGDVLPVKEGDRILDLCAAPGGKSTQVAARMGRDGILYANDISASRAQALLKNLEMAGIGNIFVTAETPENLSRSYEDYFDAILVDAPCSGEGMIRKDSSMFRDWLEKGPAFYQPIQENILDIASRMLRPGGYMLYSTCTFAREEDEGNVEVFLASHPEMHLEPISLRPGFSVGFLPGTVRLWPHHTRGEGHFLALLRKEEEEGFVRRRMYPAENPPMMPAGGNRRNRKKNRSEVNGKKAPIDTAAEISEGFPMEKQCPDLLTGGYLMLQGEKLYRIPEGEAVVKGIHYLRTGLFLGEWKKGKFNPSQAMAMVMDGESYPDRVDLAWEDERVIRYLKGETVFLEETEAVGAEGYVLVCAGGYPLGWAKRKKETLKNQYAAGWRML